MRCLRRMRPHTVPRRDCLRGGAFLGSEGNRGVRLHLPELVAALRGKSIVKIKLWHAGGCVLTASAALAQWQPDMRLTFDPAFSSTTFGNARSIASGGNALHVVLFDDRDGNQEIYFKRSIDGGTSW